MKVFISYSRRDEALAHLLKHALERDRIECDIDRHIATARPFPEETKKKIASCQIVLVLVTSASVQSAWVNQEIGYGTALGKTIWPVSMERDLDPRGMIATLNAYSLVDWSRPSETIRGLVRELNAAVESDRLSDDSRATPVSDRVITNKLERTRYLARSLEGVNRSAGPIEILNQASFSIFAYREEDAYRNAAAHSGEYMAALSSERQAMESLLTRDDVSVRLLLWPVRAYAPGLLQVRFENLIAWLRKNQGQANLRVRCGPYDGYNRLIVRDRFVVEGYKAGETSGYEMSVVRYQRDAVDSAISDFETAWGRATAGQAAVDEIERRFERFLVEIA